MYPSPNLNNYELTASLKSLSILLLIISKQILDISLYL